MHKIGKKVIRELQDRLYGRRGRLTNAIQRRIQECNDSGGYRLSDVVDIASLASSEQLGMLVAETELEELKQIDDALARIDSGGYGICKHCGGIIRKDRLKALPYATLCVKCKELEEEGHELEGRSSGQGYQAVLGMEGLIEAGEEESNVEKRSTRAGKTKSKEYSRN